MESKSKLIKSSKSLILILIFLSSTLIFGQDCGCEVAKDEQLRKKYQTACFSGNPELLEEVVTILEKEASIFCKQEALNWRATFTTFSSDMKKCKELLDKQQVLLDKFPCLQNKAIFHNIKANYYMHSGLLDSVATQYLKEQKIYEQLKNKGNQANSLLNLSTVFSKMKQFDKQHFYLKKASILAPKITNEIKRANTTTGIAIGYSDLSESYNNKAFLDTAFVFSNKVLKYTDGIKNTAYIRFGALKVNQLKAFSDGDIQKSIVINLKRKSLLNPNFHVRDLYFINELIAQRYKDNKQFNLANRYLDSSKIYANKLNNQLSSNWYHTKYEVLKGLKKHKVALLNYEKYVQFTDSIQKKERFNKLNELETKYQTELKDVKISNLNQQKKIDDLSIRNKKSQIKWLILLVLLAILVTIIIWFYFSQRALKNKQKIMETEERLNRARINPHFFFNGMASLQKLSFQENSPETTLFISRFAKIMRQSLESTYAELTTVEDEIDFLNQYLEIQKLRYPDKFEYQFHIDASLEINELKIPGMLMQPFIENAIEHGFKDIDYLGEISITFKEENTNLIVIVDDNGKGTHPSEIKKERKSRAMQIIKDRLYLFNNQHKSKAFYKVISDNKNGFKIQVTLPKIYE